MRKIIITLFLLLPFIVAAFSGQKLDLAGEWTVRLDNDKDKHAIALPGTTDMACIGIPDTLSSLLQKPQLLHLTRKNRVVGNADLQDGIVDDTNTKFCYVELNM